MAAVSGNLARSTSWRFPGWGRCGDVMGTSAPNVPMNEVACFVSVTGTMGTLGTLGTFTGLSFIRAPLSHACVYVCVHVRDISAREEGITSPTSPTSPFPP
jgi:hypothetical protein